ncbi:enoyl-CoA hydratase-related protein [Sphingomonas profundi]|uniref:enoyl-CoA hydratase-related protein n=1 Tax=Alterirhizorhabdus profundi TaxID=2681549 RepID=UPI0012E6FFED|nr:enoyl-CoA hydratase-related protein [Sphingomonas profundi]
MNDQPVLQQFRIEHRDNGLVHLVFDCPGRTMNVFSEAAIAEFGAFAHWLADADVRGVVVRSGKANAFCAGADLSELGVAYDMIMKAPPRARFGIAFDHFFRLSSAIRALETAGKPVAAAIAGLALGGGCELALGAHHRVLVDDPKIGLGLPESLVGLLPGAGGTQRLPRLIGCEAALPILLDGRRLAGTAALEAGLVDALAAPGEEIARAEAWLLSAPEPSQPWDRDGWVPAQSATVSAAIAPWRERILAETLGHYPAPLAILDCVEFGLPQVFDGAIRSEMAIFAHLIQREEPRNMIQTLFLGKTDHDRLVRKDALPGFVAEAVSAAQAALEGVDGSAHSLAGFAGTMKAPPVRSRATSGYWIDGDMPEAAAARHCLDVIGGAVLPIATTLTPEERRLVDYAIVQATGYPAYLGGPLAYAARASAP